MDCQSGTIIVEFAIVIEILRLSQLAHVRRHNLISTKNNKFHFTNRKRQNEPKRKKEQKTPTQKHTSLNSKRKREADICVRCGARCVCLGHEARKRIAIIQIEVNLHSSWQMPRQLQQWKRWTKLLNGFWISIYIRNHSLNWHTWDARILRRQSTKKTKNK